MQLLIAFPENGSGWEPLRSFFGSGYDEVLEPGKAAAVSARTCFPVTHFGAHACGDTCLAKKQQVYVAEAMYHNSTQLKHWTFAKEDEISKLRAEANRKFKMRVLATGKVPKSEEILLDPLEELTICKYYEKRLLEFCAAFKPVMPKSVVGTACMYFKRFYMNNSVMEFHPRIIMLTCTYLACKVDEFNVSSIQFVGNLRDTAAGQDKALEQILEYELLLIQQLNFHLIIHNPYRPFEGFLIDLKTRYPMLENPEVLRKMADDFLNHVSLTDACLLFTPSKIALTAVLSTAARAGINMESYLLECLSMKENKEAMSQLMEDMKRMKDLVKKYEAPKPEDVALLKPKLENWHKTEFAFNTNGKRKGFEDNEYITKKPKLDEEEWSDDDMVEPL